MLTSRRSGEKQSRNHKIETQNIQKEKTEKLKL